MIECVSLNFDNFLYILVPLSEKVGPLSTHWGSLHIQTGLVELTAVTPPPVNHTISDLLQKV